MVNYLGQEYYFLAGGESEGERLERLLVEEAVARHIEVTHHKNSAIRR